jgi:DNA-binding beta-propeller fold protein YncE
VAIGENGAIYVADLRDRVLEIDRETDTIKQVWPLHIGTARGAANLALAGRVLYVTDPDRNTLAAVHLDTGQIERIGRAGSDPGQFSVPVGVAVDRRGSVYVVDSDNARVQVFGARAPK